MSMDAKIYVIDDLDIELDGIFDSDSLKDSYIFYPISYGHPFEVLEKYAKKVMIRYHYTNYDHIGKDYFNGFYDYFDYVDDGLEFYYRKHVLGKVSKDDVKKYTADTEELSYIVKVDDIYNADNAYIFQLETGAYSFNELLEECNRLVEHDDDSGYFYEIIYALVKAIKKSKEGKKIYLEVD